MGRALCQVAAFAKAPKAVLPDSNIELVCGMPQNIRKPQLALWNPATWLCSMHSLSSVHLGDLYMLAILRESVEDWLQCCLKPPAAYTVRPLNVKAFSLVTISFEIPSLA